MRDLTAFLARRREQGLYRQVRTFGMAGDRLERQDGAPLTAFCSNDYLGLANDERVARAVADSARVSGAGSGAAHLVSGHRPAHERLERELAEFLGRDRALLFSTGYMANMGVIDALSARGDTVIQDRLNHASLLDGARLSEARLVRYAHGDANAAAERLETARGERLLATDGVFSMDGDIAPLHQLATAAHEREALLMVDDAHGIGVVGDHGAGTVADGGLDQEAVPVLVGTLGKAFGVSGAFVAGSFDLCDYLVQTARSYIYTTAPPPSVAEGVRTALGIIRYEPERRRHLHGLIERFRAGAAQRGMTLMPSQTPIQPVIAGDAEVAAAWSGALESYGYLVPAIRPPTVPEGSARLRVTLSAAHAEADVDGLLAGLDAARDAVLAGEGRTG